jgi:protein-L-isoaspartate(D-aspartate) O-methyltransferase
MPEAIDFTEARAQMVARQLAGRGISDRRVLDAMRAVPREAFVAEQLAGFAYDDGPLPVEEGQTISQPYIVALMLEAARIAPEDTVLEIGAGSGYAAAVMSRLARRVVAIERHGVLARLAAQRLRLLGCDNVEIICTDGTRGWPEAAPYDAIIVSAGSPDVPDALKRQLAGGGRLVIPVGHSEHHQTLLRLTRRDGEDFSRENLGLVSFVPLIGEQGWPSPGDRGPRPGEADP